MILQLSWRKYNVFRMFVITHVPQAQNIKADSLGQGAQIQPSYFPHMDTDSPFLLHGIEDDWAGEWEIETRGNIWQAGVLYW